MNSLPSTEDAGFASGCVLAGSLLLGLRLGEELFRASYGFVGKPALAPWWYSAAFLGAATIICVNFRGALFRIAVGVFGAGYALALLEGMVPSSTIVTARTAAGFVGAILLVAAGWRGARAWARLVACSLLLSAIPLRYAVMKWGFGVSSVLSLADGVVLEPSVDERRRS
jgi:hypothetical protein